jgi:glutamate synthase domain-containing protein 2
LTRIPLEGYRESCSTRTILGTRFASKPIELDIPVMITGMSFGALSYNAKVALARGARAAGTSTTTGDGGMLPAERENSKTLIYEVLPSRYGINVHHLRQADAIELTIGQGAKPGTGGLLLGSKVSPEIARMRDLPEGVDQRSPCRHPDFLGPDDMIIKIEELREATDWRVPIFVKLGASRVYDDVKLAAKAGADVIVIDGMEGGTGASPELLQEHTGIPTLAAVCEARAALEELGLYGVVQLIIAGGLRHGSDMAKAIALGADACYVGTAALIALNCNKPLYVEDYAAIGAAPYHCHHCHTGRCPVGITTQDPELVKRLDIDAGAERVANWLYAVTSEIQILARACGKRDVHDLEPEDLRALTLEASMITGVPLAGTNVVFAGGPGWRRSE